jgi:hypothetical protein
MDRQQVLEIKTQLQQIQRQLQDAYSLAHDTSADKTTLEAMLIAIANRVAELELQLQSLGPPN